MDFPFVEIASRVLIVPNYYTQNEKELALALTALLLLGWPVASFIISKAKIKMLKGIAIAVILLTAFFHWLFMDVGGVFFWQMLLRGSFFFSLGFAFGKTPES